MGIQNPFKHYITLRGANHQTGLHDISVFGTPAVFSDYMKLIRFGQNERFLEPPIRSLPVNRNSSFFQKQHTIFGSKHQ